ncbi:alkaline phosphatase family protein [Paenibacillus sp. J2TS4]|uniref:alkaline phosphatase family protein n=1 Tax=Paenibacillus sp. J2TS4 TaxID=2807194 RepID=UPI001B057459|nr:alkaline phosphatase family protein [Paenibacillus sp. J2TS4]GIP36534.1 phosphodiesterase [Paenibacillus sp. J2TS4]
MNTKELQSGDKAICKRVIIIGLDGAGNFIKDTPTPHIHRVLQNGAYTYNAQTVFPSISAQCWGSMFHGVDPAKHGLDNTKAFEEKYPDDSPYPSFMKLAKEQWPEGRLAAFCEWRPIIHGIIEESCGFDALSLPDPELAASAVEYIRNHPDLRMMFIHFGEPDYTGHEFGYGAHVPEYLAKITETDRYVGQVLDAIREAGWLEDSLIILTSDHGGGGDHPRGHGSGDPQDMTVFWGCHGPHIQPGTQLTGEISLKDTASIVAYALGLPPCEAWEGKVPANLFTRKE